MAARTILCLSAVPFVSMLAIAQAGSLDGDFDADGIVTTAVGPSSDAAYGVAVQPDGKIVAGGTTFNGSNYDFAAVRYNIDGSLDNTFSVDAKVTTAIGTGDDVCNALAIQADGRILLAGWSASVGGTDFALVRYNTDGTLDNAFSVDGKVTTAVGSSGDLAFSIAVQVDGKIMVAGYAVGGNADMAVVRYNTDGTLDDTFSGDGKLIVPVGTADDAAYGMALQADEKIVLAGYSFNGSENDIALVRLATDGTLDNTFSVDGRVTTSIGSYSEGAASVAVQADQKILVAGYSQNGLDADVAVVRYNTDGTLDNSFSGDGKVTTAVGSGEDAANSVLVQPDGRILVAGYSSNGSDNDFALVRYDADGALDNTFSGDGKVTTPIGAGTFDVALALTLQQNGRIVVAGGNNAGGIAKFAVARYLSGMNIGMVEFSANNTAALIYPNPLANEAVLEYELATAGELTCELFDPQGRLARTLFSNADRAAGLHRETLDLSELAAGQYSLVLSNGEGKVMVRVVKQ